jgi:predicted metal-dependent peptidase
MSEVQFADIDMAALNKAYARTERAAFMDNQNPVFLGSILCSMERIWTADLPTAAVNGINLFWNPYFFLSLPENLRVTVLIHELWHVGRLHFLRRGTRSPSRWNRAADYEINNPMERDGYNFKDFKLINFPPCINHDYDGMSAEEIFDILEKEENTALPMFQDILEPDENEVSHNKNVIDAVSVVIRAQQAAAIADEDLPEAIKYTIDQFLTPKIPWNEELYGFFNALIDSDYTMQRPNRRYNDVYMSSLQPTEGLENLMYFVDVSGSITDPYIIRFNSELKYIKETFNPEKLTVVQFDHRIQDVKVFTDEDEFGKIEVVGRGGTSLSPVRELILKEKPTAVIIFSDLECAPMEKVDCPIIWVVVNNPKTRPAFGRIINIQE